MRQLWTLMAAAALVGGASASAQAAGQEWGTIKGQVVWAGEVPKAKQVNVNKDPQHCLAKGAILEDKLVVNPKNKGVRWVLVWLDTAPPATPNGPKDALPIHPKLAKPAAQKVTMDQPCCMFEPHVLGLQEGQVLEVKNSAPVSHNVNWTGNPIKNPGGNQLIPAGGALEIKDLKADRYPITVACNIHPWMGARVGVFSHPYFAVTDADGNFEIKDAPAGTYYLKVWQEEIGWRGGSAGRNGEKITIKPNAVTNLGTLELKPNK